MTMLHLPLRCVLPVAILAIAAGISPAQTDPRPPEPVFHEAWYRHHAEHDLQAALGLYRKVAADEAAPPELRREAQRLAAEVAEELASDDFTKLVPAETILYVELNRPGVQLARLVEQLGLDARPGELGISPRLLDGLLGMRGAALAITGFDPRGGPPSGVLIVHPGELDVLRGAVETMLPAGGEAVGAIDGHPTWCVDGQVFVTTTARLIVVSQDPEQIACVVARLGGVAPDGSLATRASLASAMALRGDDLLFACLNLEPLMPTIRALAEAGTRRDPAAQAVLGLLDLDSTRYVAARLGVDADGASVDLAVELAEGHRNLAFNLLRMPPLDEDALDMVPSGAAAFWAAAINHRGQLPGGAANARGEPVVTALDFGRELFANLTDAALFVMPSAARTPHGPIPDAALALRVNDPERSRALWQFVLGAAGAASGGSSSTTELGSGVTIDRYELHGMPLFVATDGQHLVLSPSEATIGRAIAARRDGETLRQDSAFAAVLSACGEDCTQAAAWNTGRVAELVAPFLGERERREAMPFLQMLADTSVWLRVSQSDRRLAIAARVSGLPDVRPILEQRLQMLRSRGRPGRAAVSMPEAAPAGTSSGRRLR